MLKLGPVVGGVLVALGAFALAPRPAAAMTTPAPAAGTLSSGALDNILRVDGGCGGPQYFRAWNGRCYVKGYAPPPPPPPPPYGRACPPYYHPTPYGCRPNY